MAEPSPTNFFQLVAELQKHIDTLNQVLKGGKTETVVVDGVVKPVISKAINDAFIAINALVTGRLAYATKAEMDSAGAPPSGTGLAEVWDDGTNNGLYGWTGSAWKRSEYDLYSTVQRLGLANGNMWYLDKGADRASNEANRTVLIDAIKDVRGHNLKNPDEIHWISIWSNNDPTYKDRLYIKDQSGTTYRPSPETKPDGWENGAVWVNAFTSSDRNIRIELLIDFRKLPDGVLWNSAQETFCFSPSWLNHGFELNKADNALSLKKSLLVADPSIAPIRDFWERQWMPFFESYGLNVDEVSHPYRLETFTVDDPTYGTRMIIKDAKNRSFNSHQGGGQVVDEGSLTRFRCKGDTGYIDVVVNIDEVKKLPYIGTLIWNQANEAITFTAQEGCNAHSRELALSQTFPLIDIPNSNIANPKYREVAEAMLSAALVVGDGLTVDDLRIQVLTKQPGDHDDSIWFCNATDTLATWAGRVSQNDQPQTITARGTSSGQYVEIQSTIDWSKITGSGTIINGTPPNAPIRLKNDQTGKNAAQQAVKAHEETFHIAQWLDPSAKTNSNWNSQAAYIASLVKGFHLEGTQTGVIYGIGTITKNSDLYGTKVDIWDDNKKLVATGKVDQANPDGETYFEIKSSGTISGKVWIDMTPMEDGVVENTNTPRLLLNPNYVEIRALKDIISPPPNEDSKTYLREAIRLACMGSSITWGAGYVGQSSFVGIIEKQLREHFATTYNGASLSGTTRLSEPMQYKGQIGYLEGIGSSTQTDLTGDEVSLAICKERGNDHAAIIQVYIDGSLEKTFSTYNEEPFNENVVKNITADGVKLSWDLDTTFTYNHRVTLDGQDQLGGLYTGGYGGKWPDGWQYMIVRKTSEHVGLDRVTHWLTFKTKPANNAKIVCTFDHGETITPMRSTVGNKEKGLGTGIESTYGDGNTSYDPANPVGLSSGLDFRYSDDRAVITMSFLEVKARKVEVRVVGSDSRVISPEEPRLYIGFITNKMHHIMNAGIGGFKASSFDKPYKDLKGHYKVSQWKPTHITMESCTNDDWDTNKYLCWNDKQMTKAQLMAIDSLLWIETFTKEGTDNYKVSDSRIEYESITPFTVVLKASTTKIGDIQVGDVVSFGTWKGDNRSVTSKVITDWDSTTRTITFSEELRLDEFGWKMADLTDIETITVRSLSKWKSSVDKVVTALMAANPNAQLSISTSGVPNMRIRRLEGYTPYGQTVVSKGLNVDFVNYYKTTRDWTESAKSNVPVYLDNQQGNISNGDSELPLFRDSGSELQNYWSLRGWSVKVDGVERYLDGCYIIGGARRAWASDISEPTMKNYSWVYDQYKVVFTKDTPPAGSVVDVTYSGVNWSGDDCHPNPNGYLLFGKAFNEYLRKVL